MGAIDDSKPIKPSEEVEKDIIVDGSQNPPEKPKKKNSSSKKIE